MNITFSDIAWNDLLAIAQDRRLLKRLNQLITDIQRDGTSGIGKPEPLSGELSGFFSRRIDERHRLIYRIVDGTIEIVQCQGHYNDR
ncbi:MAG: Txe/YoeB family addiction module toxin [Propionibacteriaceae bacterium]|jgi:toxin YoeB|nr:Txe/YoeB family addiction module toxin [Propionibacteriaceae bacterium]